MVYKFDEWLFRLDEGTISGRELKALTQNLREDAEARASYREYRRISTHTAGSASTAPRWVKLVRSGNTITGFESSNGTTWTQVESIDVAMAQDVHVGLAVTSHNDGTLCEAVFDNVAVTEPEPDPDPPSGGDVVWTDLVNCVANGNTVTKTGTADAWDAAAFSEQSIAGDGGAAFTVAQLGQARFFGLSTANHGTGGFSNIDYSFYVKANNWVNIYAGGSPALNNVFCAAAGDILTLERDGTTIKYLRNGSVVYTATDVASANLFVDVALYHPGAEIANAVIFSGEQEPEPEPEPEPDPDPPSGGDVVWTDLVNCVANGNTVTKTGTEDAMDAGAFSEQWITGDGGTAFTVAQAGQGRFFGLSTANHGLSGYGIDYSFYVKANNLVNIYVGTRHGEVIFNAFRVAAGDTLALEREGTTMKYIHNGSVIYTATTNVTSADLFVDVVLYSAGAEIANAVIY